MNCPREHIISKIKLSNVIRKLRPLNMFIYLVTQQRSACVCACS